MIVFNAIRIGITECLGPRSAEAMINGNGTILKQVVIQGRIDNVVVDRTFELLESLGKGSTSSPTV